MRQVCRNATATLDELECHITTLNAGESPHPPHTHPDEEVVVIREGTLEVTFGDRKAIVGPGSVIFQAANQPHTFGLASIEMREGVAIGVLGAVAALHQGLHLGTIDDD